MSPRESTCVYTLDFTELSNFSYIPSSFSLFYFSSVFLAVGPFSRLYSLIQRNGTERRREAYRSARAIERKRESEKGR